MLRKHCVALRYPSTSSGQARRHVMVSSPSDSEGVSNQTGGATQSDTALHFGFSCVLPLSPPSSSAHFFLRRSFCNGGNWPPILCGSGQSSSSSDSSVSLVSVFAAIAPAPVW